jgi:hypothetical protein
MLVMMMFMIVLMMMLVRMTMTMTSAMAMFVFNFFVMMMFDIFHNATFFPLIHRIVIAVIFGGKSGKFFAQPSCKRDPAAIFATQLHYQRVTVSFPATV